MSHSRHESAIGRYSHVLQPPCQAAPLYNAAPGVKVKDASELSSSGWPSRGHGHFLSIRGEGKTEEVIASWERQKRSAGGCVPKIQRVKARRSQRCPVRTEREGIDSMCCASAVRSWNTSAQIADDDRSALRTGCQQPRWIDTLASAEWWRTKSRCRARLRISCRPASTVASFFPVANDQAVIRPSLVPLARSVSSGEKASAPASSRKRCSCFPERASQTSKRSSPSVGFAETAT